MATAPPLVKIAAMRTPAWKLLADSFADNYCRHNSNTEAPARAGEADANRR
jgi:hypothetical protein